MRPAGRPATIRGVKRTLASLLLVVAGLLLALSRWLDPGAAVRNPHQDAPRAERPSAPQSSAPSRPDGPPSAALASTGDALRDGQVALVVAAMDQTGRPPAGVAQGGRRGGPKGVFDNRQGRLPRRGAGYYVESDIWPRGPAGRGTYRLVFGREGEVYYTSDHYRTFTRLR